jgi:F420-dependent oxidoreductase-like protein
MQVGIHITGFSWPGGVAGIGPTLAETAKAADDAGIASISVMDHFFQLGGPFGAADEPMLEGYTTLGHLAGLTRRTRLHLLVTGVTYRHPGILAKIVSTLDVLSGGRATLGIGAAWYEREHLALGVPFPPLAERFERLEETLQIVKQMWSDDNGPYHGKHYRLEETLNEPQPLQRPHPPILVGGGGERKTLRLVARYADAWNLITGPGSRQALAGRPAGPDFVADKLDVLREHCRREGTDYDRIEKSILYVGPPPATVPSAAAFVEEMKPYAELDVRQVVLMPFGPDPVGFVEHLAGNVVPQLAGL